MNWLLHISGISDTSGRWFAWWSGPGSDIGELAIIATVIATYRKFNCHIKRCWRLARHEYDLDGVKYHLCHKHHPATDERPTVEDFNAHHKQQVK